jgi:hypothetical protein
MKQTNDSRVLDFIVSALGVGGFYLGFFCLLGDSIWQGIGHVIVIFILLPMMLVLFIVVFLVIGSGIVLIGRICTESIKKESVYELSESDWRGLDEAIKFQ